MDVVSQNYCLANIRYKRPTWFADYASRGTRLHMKKHTSEMMCVQFRSHVTWLQNSIKHLVVYFSSGSKGSTQTNFFECFPNVHVVILTYVRVDRSVLWSQQMF